MIQYFKDTLVVDVVQNYRYYGKCQETGNKISVTLHVLVSWWDVMEKEILGKSTI